MPALRSFQATGSTFLQRCSQALLCDDAGLGKSATVLDAADRLGLKRILCVGPAVAGVSWPRQVAQWSPRRVYVDLDMGTTFGFDLPGFYFVSYDTVSQKRNAGLIATLSTCRPWDLLVIDEGQYLKTPHSNRTMAVYGAPGAPPGAGLAGNALRHWVLSGTLTPNHAGEAYTHLRRLFGARLQTLPYWGGRMPEQFEFEARFTRFRDSEYGRIITGSQNMLELRDVLAPILLRRRKSEVLTELAPMEWYEAPIVLDPATVRKIYEDQIRTTWTMSYDDVLALSDDALLALLHQPGVLSTQRRMLGLAKIPGCVDWVIDRLEAGEPKVIVFAHHRDVLAGLRDALRDYNPVLYDGSTPPDQRSRIVEQFQTDPQTRVFCGQLVAAGTAITLTAAKTVLLAEFATTPGVNYQAASRAHRIGQQDGVQVYFGMVPGSLDERIARLAAQKAREISEIFD